MRREVIILCVSQFPFFTTHDFRMKEKNVLTFLSLRHFTKAFFILVSSKLRCFRITFILPTSVMTIPNLEIFLFCQYNSTHGGNLKLRQTIVLKFGKIVKLFSRVRASMVVYYASRSRTFSAFLL
jgi:hypothetical protein